MALPSSASPQRLISAIVVYLPGSAAAVERRQAVRDWFLNQRYHPIGGVSYWLMTKDPIVLLDRFFAEFAPLAPGEQILTYTRGPDKPVVNVYGEPLDP